MWRNRSEIREKWIIMKIVKGTERKYVTVFSRGELSYLAPLGSEKNFRPLFQAMFLSGGDITPQTESNTTPPSPKTEITNILFYILNFASIITFKM